jgi:hypothetical protein
MNRLVLALGISLLAAFAMAADRLAAPTGHSKKITVTVE